MKGINYCDSVILLERKLVRCTNFFEKLKYCYSLCAMFEINITLEFHRTKLKFEKSVEQIYETINTIQHSKETADVAAQISLESPHYGGFYDGDLKVSEDKEVIDNKDYSTEERQYIAVPEKEADNKGVSGAINVGKKVLPRNNSIIFTHSEDKYAAEDANNNADEEFKNERGAIADETNANDTTTEANIDSVSSTKACAKVCINANNGNDNESEATGAVLETPVVRDASKEHALIITKEYIDLQVIEDKYDSSDPVPAKRIKSKLIAKNEVKEVISVIVESEEDEYDFDFSSTYHDAIVDEKGNFKKQLNKYATEDEYTAEGANNADEEITNEVELDDGTNKQVKSFNNDDVESDVEDDDGFLDAKGKDATPIHHSVANMDLDKPSQEKRAKLWSWVPGYYCYKYRKRKPCQ
ncbi:hypothetical protein CVS40_6565 [Lucilia cuprina]|nr:hypothetical protein CVS40_6565 [Lucilia cuprina]